MPLTSRQLVLTMSPELIQKFEAASKTIETDASQSSAMPENIVCELEKTLDSTKDIVLVDEKRFEPVSEHVSMIDSPEPVLPEEHDADNNGIQINVDSGSIEKLDNADGDSSGGGLFEVSVDISEPEQSDSDHDSDSSYSIECKRNSLTSPEYYDRRRSSRWSATVLFLASDIQLMVNLAQLSPPEGYELAPPKKVSCKSFVARCVCK